MNRKQIQQQKIKTVMYFPVRWDTEMGCEFIYSPEAAPLADMALEGADKRNTMAPGFAKAFPVARVARFQVVEV